LKEFFLYQNLLHILIFIISLIVTFGIFGIDVQGIITGLGLASFIMGFALKDVISNLLSGFSILFYGPFKIGDVIIIDGIYGTVLKMDIHYIVLDTGNELCYIPNSYITRTKIMVKNKILKEHIK
jgi:small conductance mechanosensitive channel